MYREVYILMLHLKIGGVEICSINLANSLAKRGYKVTLISVLKSNEFEKAKILENVIIEYLTNFKADKIKKKSAIIQKILRKIFIRLVLCKKIKSLKSGAVISTRNEYSVLLSQVGQKNVLKIAQLHHDYMGHHIENDFKYRYNNIDYFVQLTDEVKNEISEIMTPYNSKTKIIVIPNYLPDEVPITTALIEKRKPIAVAVGRLASEKGFIRLIDIWYEVNKLKKSEENFQLWLIGEGNEKSSIEERIKEYNLVNSIKLLGLRDNGFVNEVMRKASVYCMTSLTEAFPMVLLEALKNGLPQIAYDVRVGPRNLIRNNETGYLITENDAADYAKKIVDIFRNEALFVELSRNSHEHFKNYTEDEVIKKWIEILG